MRRLLWIVGVATILAASAQPAFARGPSTDATTRSFSDNLSSPLQARQAALKLAAQEAVLNGTVTPTGVNQLVKLHNGRHGKYIQLAPSLGEDQILTLLGQFGSGTPAHLTHLDGDPAPTGHGGAPGPAHNEIPEPDRSVDNTTVWAPDFSQSYYQTMIYDKNHYPSMANYYYQTSSGQYTIDGYVSDWVNVPNNEATYGSDYCGGIVCTDTWLFVQDQANAWWDEMVADMGETAAKAFLADFDVWDRYDWDGDGNFDEPDGYIDHFQSVHAGDGEETGGGDQGADAIWSHRWYAFYNTIGSEGPGNGNLAGGIQIGDSDVWIGDYTIEPENGGVGVFAHEFGHDLGLPDEYDTSGNTGGAENGTGWWTNWSQGSYGTQGDNQLGTYPVAPSAWEKFQLGWLQNYVVAAYNAHGKVVLGPSEYNTARPQGMFIVLPDRAVQFDAGDPYAGSMFYYSGAANDLETTMTRDVTLGAGTPGLSAKVRYNIETDFDYAQLTVNGTPVATNLSNSGVAPQGIEGDSGGWVNLTANLTAYAGQTVTIGFRYVTDGGVQGNGGATPPGFAIDDLNITGLPTDGAESDAGWEYDSDSMTTGFHATTGTETSYVFNAYVVENRQYIGYDDSLRQGPYNFGFLDNPDYGNWVEHFPLQNGLLIWYWNTQYEDNNVGDHPGEGEILPVDSHPKVMHWPDGTVVRPRINSYDATFTGQKTDKITLHRNSEPTTFKSRKGVNTFDDTHSYWVASDPGDALGHYQASWNSVKLPGVGVTIKIVYASYIKVKLTLNP